MNKLVQGIHHVTALASDAQKNLDFYSGILGLRFIKKTVNFDAPEIYHLYYGNDTGDPGTIMTFFPYQGMPRGKPGKGQLTVTSFSVSDQGLDFWLKRLRRFGVIYHDPQVRFDETVVACEDYDGLGLELVFNSQDKRKGFSHGTIPLELAIKGFYGITLTVEGEQTANLLTEQLDHQWVGEGGNRFRYSASQLPGDFVDILYSPDSLFGVSGSGTVHHVAFKTENDAFQAEIREKLMRSGIDVTPMIDRQYFHSIYFKEPGGVLFEIATTFPGFTVDETAEHLGDTLKLPPRFEKVRGRIEQRLTPLHFNSEDYK